MPIVRAGTSDEDSHIMVRREAPGRSRDLSDSGYSASVTTAVP